MATVQQTAASTLQPLVAAIVAFQAALETFGDTPSAALDTAATLNSDAGTLSAAYPNYANLVNLAAILLSLISTPQTKEQIVALGGSLYEFAALYYNDITQAFPLMDANDLPSPWLSNKVPTTISIPPAQTLQPATGVGAAQVTP